MGAVYLAEHVVIEKKFALKVLAPELARRSDLVARFLQEARSASRIGHENVIDISDFGQSPDGLVYIAMEYLDGKDLGEIVRSRGAVEWKDARDIVLQICRALRAAHDKGIVHRDMKPENIFLIQREDQPHFVKILDFGIAKVMGLDPNGPRLTRTGMIFGTPEYMAPEQAEGKDTDHRADIYAVGCILYHLLTGQTPFVAESFMTMLTKHLMEDPVPPSVRRPDLTVTPEMDALVLKALEKDRDKRWQSMAELMEAVAVCPGPTSASPKPMSGQTVEMGGAHAAAALKILRSRATAPETERLSRRAVDSALSSAEMVETPRRASGNKTLVLVVVGVALGLGVAIWLALGSGKAPPPQTPTVTPTPSVPVAPPTPVPTTPPPAAGPGTAAGAVPAATVTATQTNAETAATDATPSEPTGKKGGRVRKPRGTRHTVATGTAASTTKATTGSKPMSDTPSGLKPFPNAP